MHFCHSWFQEFKNFIILQSYYPIVLKIIIQLDNNLENSYFIEIKMKLLSWDLLLVPHIVGLTLLDCLVPTLWLLKLSVNSNWRIDINYWYQLMGYDSDGLWKTTYHKKFCALILAPFQLIFFWIFLDFVNYFGFSDCLPCFNLNANQKRSFDFT